MIYARRDLGRLIEVMSKSCYPGLLREVTPNRQGNEFVIPILGEENSHGVMAFKRVEDGYLSGKYQTAQTVEDIFTQYEATPLRQRELTAYSLSHELKVAALVFCVSSGYRDIHVFEVGSAEGFGICLLAHLMKNSPVQRDNANVKLTAIELVDKLHEAALFQEKAWRGAFQMSAIEFVCGDARRILPESARDGDLVYASLAEPEVIESIIELQNSKSMTAVLSYSVASDDHIKDTMGRLTEELMDSSGYYVIPFEDTLWNSHVNEFVGRQGIIATRSIPPHILE